jgi:hypothetical protein
MQAYVADLDLDGSDIEYGVRLSVCLSVCLVAMPLLCVTCSAKQRKGPAVLGIVVTHWLTLFLHSSAGQNVTVCPDACLLAARCADGQAR